MSQLASSVNSRYSISSYIVQNVLRHFGTLELYSLHRFRQQLSKKEKKADEKEDEKTSKGDEELKKENDALKEENERLKQEVEEESEQNKTNSARLQKLENMLKVQAIEMQRNEELNRLLRMKYEDVVKKNKEMENELTSLNSQVMDFQHQLDLSEERSDMVQRELDACKETLAHMKEKTESLKEMLKEKSNQVTDLAKDCAATRDNMQSLNNEAMMLASDARFEVDTLKQKVQNLQRNLEAANSNYQRVSEDARRHQAQLLESANREIKLQMEFTTKENFLLDKLHKTQAENSKMSDVVDLLNRDNQELRTELTEREGQLQATANKLQNLVQDTAKLQKEMESKDNTTKKLEGGLSRSNLKLMQALNHIENKDKIIEDLKKELRAAQTENNKLQEQLQEAKLQEQAQNDELQQQVHMLQLAVMDAKDQCNKAQVQMKEFAAANNQLKATCKNLETELDNLQAAFQQKEAITNQLMTERQNMVKNSSELRRINVALRQALRASRRRETKLMDWPPPSTSHSYYLEDVSPPPALTQTAESTYWVMSKSSTSLWPNEDENVKKNNLYWKRTLQNTDYYDDSKETVYHSSSSK
ncbi:restin homolog [Anabrus simplex]|uniref:restin homolog n=1 Tax=Anabrus simplex TaxID=316456 RepID=UPI0035A3B7E4